MDILTQTLQTVNYTPNGYAINPATGQTYTRTEVITDPNYPALLPKFVDRANVPAYWRQMTGQELEAERKRITAKNKRNEAARARNAGKSSKAVMDNRIGWAVAGLVERTNDPVETFVTETTDPLAQDPDEVDGPRNLAESIMELNGQDYKAARKSSQRIAQPTQAQAQAMLDKALKPGAGSGVQRHVWRFGR